MRNFFFGKVSYGSICFKGIDNNDRQGQLLRILAPSIKDYFERIGQPAGYLNFLNEYSQKGLEEARCLHGLERDGKDVVDRIEGAGSAIFDYFRSFGRSVPETYEIERKAFVQDFIKLRILCRENKLEEAKYFLASNIRNRLQTDNDSLRKSRINEHDQLCKIYENYRSEIKQENSLDFQKNALASAIIEKKAEVDLSEQKNLLKMENGGEVQNQDAQQIIAESEVASPPGPNLNDPQNEKKEANKKEKFGVSLQTDKEYSDCLEKINEIKKGTPDIKIKDHETLDVNYQKLETKASKLYESIRNDYSDIEKVSSNLRIDKNYTERVKDYVFFKRHNLRDGYRRLDPSLNIAEGWKRLADNNYSKTDLEWFLHEFAESRLSEKYIDAGHDEIHSFVSNIHDWVAMLHK